MMRTRRGFSLLEMMIAIVLFGMVGGVLYKLLLTTQRVSRAQAEQSEMQSNVRTGMLFIPSALRELGYSRNPATGAITSDIVETAADRLRFRAMRGFGVICKIVSESEIRLERGLYGYRAPRDTDRFLLFVENDRNKGKDDRWVTFTVAAGGVDLASDCDGRPAIRLTISPALNDPSIGIQVSQFFDGSPVRVAEEMEMRAVAVDGRNWLGLRSVSAGEVAFQPVLGPLSNANGFRLRYFGANNAEIAAGNALLIPNIRTIEVTLQGRTDGAISLGGQGAQGVDNLSLTTRVALRNALRP